jgi:hypothetical protein
MSIKRLYLVLLAVMLCIPVMAQIFKGGIIIQGSHFHTTFIPPFNNGTCFWVDNNGNDANSGTAPWVPWQHLHYASTNQAFLNAVAVSNVYLLNTTGQTFTDTNWIFTNVQPATGCQVYIMGYGAPMTASNYIDATSGSANTVVGLGYSCLAIDSSYITWSNIVFEGPSSFYANGNGSSIGLGLISYNQNAHHFTVTNCGFQWAEFSGLYISGYYKSTTLTATTNVIVNSCWASSNSCAGIFTDDGNAPGGPNVIDTTNIFVTNCVVTNVNGNVSVIGNGIWLNHVDTAVVAFCFVSNIASTTYTSTSAGSSGVVSQYANNVTMLACEVTACKNTSGYDGDGIDIGDLDTHNCLAEYNYIHNNDGYGILQYGSYGSNCYRFNWLESNGGPGTVHTGQGEVLIGSPSTVPTNIFMFDNTILATTSGAQCLVINGTVVTGFTNANNIWWVSNTSPSMTYGTGTYYFWNNDYYRGDGTAFSFDVNGTTYSTLAAWNTATGQDANRLGVTPNFLNGFVTPTFYPALVATETNIILHSASSLVNAAGNLNSQFGANNGGRDLNSNSVPTSGYNVGAVNASQ